MFGLDLFKTKKMRELKSQFYVKEFGEFEEA